MYKWDSTTFFAHVIISMINWLWFIIEAWSVAQVLFCLHQVFFSVITPKTWLNMHSNGCISLHWNNLVSDLKFCYWSPLLTFFFGYFQRVVDGARVCNWACINFCQDLRMNDVKKFCSDLVTWSRNTGVVIHIFIIRSIVLSTKIFLHDY